MDNLEAKAIESLRQEIIYLELLTFKLTNLRAELRDANERLSNVLNILDADDITYE